MGGIRLQRTTLTDTSALMHIFVLHSLHEILQENENEGVQEQRKARYPTDDISVRCADLVQVSVLVLAHFCPGLAAHHRVPLLLAGYRHC